MLKQFAEGSTILVDKPLHWTSFDVVNKLRWYLRKQLGVKKLKVGHAGTLDPLATGLLVICIGKHTKLIEQLMGGKKTYTGTILLGKTTPSYDLETEYNSEASVDHIDAQQLEATRQQFVGQLLQTPPLFSAKQIDGKRAYDIARAGKTVELAKAAVEVDSFTLSTERFPEIDFEICCSKGTYIRSIAHDFGAALGCGGTLIALRRTASGNENISAAKSVDEWIEFIQSSPLE